MTAEDANRFLDDVLARAGASRDPRWVAEFRDTVTALFAELQGDVERLAQMETLLERILSTRVAPQDWVDRALASVLTLERESARRTRPDSPGLVDQLRRAGDAARRIFQAHLSLDSAQGVALQGIRSAGLQEARQLLFESALGNLLVHVEARDRSHELLGQFLPATREILGRESTLLVETRTGTHTVPLGPQRQFQVGDLSDGNVRLRLFVGDDEVEFPAFRLDLPPER